MWPKADVSWRDTILYSASTDRGGLARPWHVHLLPVLETPQRGDDDLRRVFHADVRGIQHQVVVVRIARVELEMVLHERGALLLHLVDEPSGVLVREALESPDRPDAVLPVGHQPHAQGRLVRQEEARTPADDHAPAQRPQ